MNREQMIERVGSRREPWDILVIGGGATGAGIAIDAVTRGYETLLVERRDFGQGTSSRSTTQVLPDTSSASLPQARNRQSTIVRSQKSASSASEALPENTQAESSARPRMTLSASSARAAVKRQDSNRTGDS